MSKRWVSLLVAIMMIFTSLTTVLADDLSKKQNELEDVKDSISNIKDQIKNVKEDKNTVINQINQIDKQINQTESKISSLSSLVMQTNNEIKQTTIELNKKTEEYSEHKDLYHDRIRAIYMNGSSGYLEIIFSAESFSDFMSRLDMVKKVMEYDTSLLQEMKVKQQEIEKQKKMLEQKKNQLERIKNEVASKKIELDNSNRKKKEYYSKLSRDQKSLEKALAEEERTSRLLEKQIQDIIGSNGNSNLVYKGKRGCILKVSDIGHYPKMTSPYGMRMHPTLHVWKMHTGIDYGVPMRTPIYSMAEGEVIISKYLPGYGYTVVINHGSGVSTLYAHNSSLLVSVGQRVKMGQMISRAGSTGNSTGPHLHFEVRINGKHINPAPYVIIGK